MPHPYSCTYYMIKRQRVQRDLTRPAGVRVDGPLARGLWPPDGGGLCSLALRGGYSACGAEGSEGKVLKMDGPSAQGFLSLTALQAEGCGLPLRGNAYKVSVTSLPYCVIWLNKHSADWLAALATPYPGCAGLPPQFGRSIERKALLWAG